MLVLYILCTNQQVHLCCFCFYGNIQQIIRFCTSCKLLSYNHPKNKPPKTICDSASITKLSLRDYKLYFCNLAHYPYIITYKLNFVNFHKIKIRGRRLQCSAIFSVLFYTKTFDFQKRNDIQLFLAPTHLCFAE